MSDYRFTVLDVRAEPYAVTPQLTARLRVQDSAGRRIHAIALRCQIRIEPRRRRYDPDADDTLAALFGARERWADTLQPFLWLQCTAMIPGFTGATDFDLPLPCTYDLDVVGTRYLHALNDGDVPLNFLFSGTVFTRGDTAFAVEQVPWSCEARHAMPVAVWRQMIDSYYPNSGWLRVGSDVLAELAAYRARNGLVGWDETMLKLLAADQGSGS